MSDVIAITRAMADFIHDWIDILDILYWFTLDTKVSNLPISTMSRFEIIFAKI